MADGYRGRGAAAEDEDLVDIGKLLEQYKATRVHNAGEIIASTTWLSDEEPDLSTLPAAQRALRHSARGGAEDGVAAAEAIKQLVAATGVTGDALGSAVATALDAPDSRGSTALMLAARWGRVSLAKHLVAAGANPNATATYYEFGPPVPMATAEAHAMRGTNGARGFGAVSADVTLDPAHRSDTQLTPAMKPPNGGPKNKRSDRNPMGETTLTGEGKEAKKLLYPTWGQLIVETPLHNAAEQTRGALAAVLAKPGVCVNLAISPEGWTPLHVAANTVKLGQTAAVELLLSKGACVNAKDAIGMTPLAWVCTSPRPPNLRPAAEDVAIALVRNGAVVNGAIDHSGSTCLHGAAVLGYSAVAEELVKAGADLEVQGESGLTPLLVALSVSRAQAALTLIRMGADVNRRRREGRSTALHWAGGNGNEAVVSALLKAGASVNALDHHCVSPLLAAAARGQLKACRIMCRWGANDRLYNLDGHAPYSLARMKGYGETANFLERFRKHVRPWRHSVVRFRHAFLASNPAVADRVDRQWRASLEYIKARAGRRGTRWTGGGASTFLDSATAARAPTEVTRSSMGGPPGGGRAAGSVAASSKAVR